LMFPVVILVHRSVPLPARPFYMKTATDGAHWASQTSWNQIFTL
jgi:hypothetical protein